jgi:hypothetical protein
MMTRQHFKALADRLKDERPIYTQYGDHDIYLALDAQWARMVKAIADVCYASNGRFDRGKFYEACGRG